jgi:hypothetical protein
MPSGFPHVRPNQSLVAKHKPRGIVVRRVFSDRVRISKAEKEPLKRRKNIEVVFVISNPKLILLFKLN